MEPEERIEIILGELERLRYGFELLEDDYRQAKIDVAVDMVEECEEMIEQWEDVDAWPGEGELSDLEWYEDRLER
jgi:hypothetical protein